jgi:SAM-dependent methyltransferase
MTVKAIKKVISRLGNRLGLASEGALRTPSGAGQELGADWYDRCYASAAGYQCSYPKSFYYFMWTVIADRVRRSGLRRVLEIGCGPGQLAAFLFEQGIQSYVGLDFSATAINLARQLAPQGRFVVGDARSPAIHRETEHELLICTEVLEHIQDDLLVVSHFLPSKRCICSVPSFPYESHVRHFATVDEVRQRYGPFFQDLDIMTFRSPNSDTDRFYLFDGVRNDHTVDSDQAAASK